MKLIEELCKSIYLTKKQLKKLHDAGFISERFFKFGSRYSDYDPDDVDPADYYDEQGRGHHVIEGVGEVWVTDGDWECGWDWDYYYDDDFYRWWNEPSQKEEDADIPGMRKAPTKKGKPKQRLFEGKLPQKLTAPELNIRLPEFFFEDTKDGKIGNGRLFQLIATLAAVYQVSGNKFDSEKAIRHFSIPGSGIDRWNVFGDCYKFLEDLPDSELTLLLIKVLNCDAKFAGKTCDFFNNFVEDIFVPLCKDDPLWEKECFLPYQGPAVKTAEVILNEVEQITFASGKYGWILKHKNIDFLYRVHLLRNKLAHLAFGIMIRHGVLFPAMTDAEGKKTPEYINIFNSCRIEEPELIRSYIFAGIHRIKEYTQRLKTLLVSPDFMISTPQTKTKNKLQIKKRLRTAGGCKWDLLTGSEWAKLLTCCPDFSRKCSKWEEFTGEDWSLLLINQPLFADKCDWEKLNSRDWFGLLRFQRQFSDRCDWEKFDKDELARLLTEQLESIKKGDSGK